MHRCVADCAWSVVADVRLWDEDVRMVDPVQPHAVTEVRRPGLDVGRQLVGLGHRGDESHPAGSRLRRIRPGDDLEDRRIPLSPSSRDRVLHQPTPACSGAHGRPILAADARWRRLVRCPEHLVPRDLRLQRRQGRLCREVRRAIEWTPPRRWSGVGAEPLVRGGIDPYQLRIRQHGLPGLEVQRVAWDRSIDDRQEGVAQSN